MSYLNELMSLPDADDSDNSKNGTEIRSVEEVRDIDELLSVMTHVLLARSFWAFPINSRVAKMRAIRPKERDCDRLFRFIESDRITRNDFRTMLKSISTGARVDLGKPATISVMSRELRKLLMSMSRINPKWTATLSIVRDNCTFEYGRMVLAGRIQARDLAELERTGLDTMRPAEQARVISFHLIPLLERCQLTEEYINASPIPVTRVGNDGLIQGDSGTLS